MSQIWELVHFRTYWLDKMECVLSLEFSPDCSNATRIKWHKHIHRKNTKLIVLKEKCSAAVAVSHRKFRIINKICRHRQMRKMLSTGIVYLIVWKCIMRLHAVSIASPWWSIWSMTDFVHEWTGTLSLWKKAGKAMNAHYIPLKSSEKSFRSLMNASLHWIYWIMNFHV